MLSDDVREKSLVLRVPLLLLRVSNPNRRPCPFPLKFSNFRQKLVSSFAGVALRTEEKDDDDDEFKEEIRTTR